MTVSAPVTKTRSVDPRETRRGDAMHRPPARSMLKKIGVIVLWQVAALLVVEGVLYWSGLGEQDIYKLDREIGFKHFPDKRVTWRSEGYSQSYFDSDGMRDPGLTIAKPVGTYRIALLGDSMVEGLQVPIDQTFGKLIEPKLSAETGRKVQVINFGNSGYSTVQEYLQLKDKVFKYKPDLVVLGYMSRDMFENWAAPDATLTNVRPIALHLPGQKLVVDSSPVQTWMRTPRAKFLRQIEWLRHHSRIWGLVTETEMQLSLQDPLYKGFLAFCTNPGKAMTEWGKNLSEFVKHPPSLAQLAAPSFSIRFFEGNNDTHAAVNRKHRKRTPNSPQLTNQQRMALVESSMDKAPSEVPTKTPQIRLNQNLVGATPCVARPYQQKFVQSSIDEAPATAPTPVGATPCVARQNSVQETLAESSIIKAPATVPSVKSNATYEVAGKSVVRSAPPEVSSSESVFTQELYTTGKFTHSSFSKASDAASKMTFVLEPQLNDSSTTPKGSIRQADIEISDSQSVPGSVKRGTAKPAAAVTGTASVSLKSAHTSSSTPTTASKSSAQPLDVSQAKNGNRTYVELMSHTMESLLSEMRNECTQNGAKFAVVFIPSRAQLSPTPGMETNFFNITYADEIRLISQGCVAEHIPFFNGERAAERVAPAQRPDLFYLMHMNAIGHKLFAEQLQPFVAQQIGKTNR